jgi:sirohydrochlorin ferrochelatase
VEQAEPLGLIVFAHGSSVAEANEAVRRAASEAAMRCGVSLWEAAFLELTQPDLAAAVQSLSEKGAARIIVTPYFLTMGIHLQRDLPLLLDEIARSHPGLRLSCAPPLDGHPALIDILAERAHQAIGS